MLDETDAPLPRPRSSQTPRRALRLLVRDDPWDLRVLCRERRRAVGAFLPLHRIVVRAFAHAAREVAVAGRPGRDRLNALVDRAIHELFEEQWSDEDRGASPDPAADGPFYRLFARITGVALDRTRLVCVALNALPSDCRRAFFAVRIDDKTRNRHVAEGHGPPRRVERLLDQADRTVRRALR